MCLVAPVLAPLGLVAGFAAGYLAFEFEKVILAAWRACGIAWRETCGHTSEGATSLVEWWRGNHPDLPKVIVGVVAGMIALPLLFDGFYHYDNEAGKTASTITLSLILTFVVSVLVGAMFDAVHQAGAEIAPRTYKNPFLTHTAKYVWYDSYYTVFQVTRVMSVFFYRLLTEWVWLGLAYGSAGGVLLVARTAKWFFILVHSRKRVLCGIDSALGATASYWLLGDLAMRSAGSTGNLAVCLCGGLIGAALGVANWEIVSRRLLGVDLVRAT